MRNNLYTEQSSITLTEREKLLNQKAIVVWFTGLSGSGKSAIANALNQSLFKNGRLSYILDGDNVRQGLNKDLDFSDLGRKENIRRISEVAKLMNDAGVMILSAFISPFIEDREEAKRIIGEERFIEVFVDTPLDICETRDVKGLYKKARSGEIPSFTGVSSPYEPPVSPSLVVKTENKTVEECASRILEYLKTVK